MPQLTKQHCTITLSGPALGMIGSLEARGHTAGYLGVVSRLIDEAQLAPGEVLLEVGCGSGVLDRWLARRTGGSNRIVGMDINPFMLRQARALVRQEGLEQLITFEEGNAEALPFPDNSFDVVMSSTVIQRVDADRMLPEMVRVARPGGRVAVVGHGHDMPRWVNLPLRAELKATVEAPGWADEGGHPRGCDEASLYQRMHRAGLGQIKMFPQFATFDDAYRLQQLQASILPPSAQKRPPSGGRLSRKARLRGLSSSPPPFIVRSGQNIEESGLKGCYGPIASTPQEHTASERRHGLDFKLQIGGRLGGHLHQGAGWIHTLEILLPHFSDLGPLLHVGEEDGDLDHVGQGRPFSLQNM